MHVIYVEGGIIKQTAAIVAVPEGVQYWHVTPEEKELMDTNRKYRDAWEWVPNRPADGIGG